jgi:hypothetical protein
MAHISALFISAIYTVTAQKIYNGSTVYHEKIFMTSEHWRKKCPSRILSSKVDNYFFLKMTYLNAIICFPFISKRKFVLMKEIFEFFFFLHAVFFVVYLWGKCKVNLSNFYLMYSRLADVSRFHRCLLPACTKKLKQKGRGGVDSHALLEKEKGNSKNSVPRYILKKSKYKFQEVLCVILLL